MEEIRAIVDEGHRAQLKVAAHAVGEDALNNVIEAGVDCIDHGAGLTLEIAEQIREERDIPCSYAERIRAVFYR